MELENFIKQYLQGFNMDILSLIEHEIVFLKKEKEDIKNHLAYYKNNLMKLKYTIEIVDEGLIINEFNLFWKNTLIMGNYRGWRNKCMEAIWKNEVEN